VTKKYIDEEKTKQRLQWLNDTLGVVSKNISFYILAFIHRSIVNERPDKAPEHNERLEFLWDAVLELVVTEKLFLDFPKKTEWELTDIRSSIVRGKNLAEVAKNLGFSEYLFLWKWEEMTWGRTNDYLLANCVESYIWAVYLDLGFEYAKEFILKNVYSTLNNIMSSEHIKDFKTLLQEFSQSEYDVTPSYKVLEDSWPDHDKIYITWVYIREKCMWKWQGSSKKKSQELAAKDAFLKFKV